MTLHNCVPMYHHSPKKSNEREKKSNLLFILSGQINHGFQLGGD